MENQLDAATAITPEQERLIILTFLHGKLSQAQRAISVLSLSTQPDVTGYAAKTRKHWEDVEKSVKWMIGNAHKHGGRPRKQP